MMKTLVAIIIALGASLGAFAKKGQEYDLFVLQGRVYEIDLLGGEDKPASEVQVVIYQNKDIYVAFYTAKNGDYEFQLPLGFEYEVWFGGSAFVNKKVYIDSRTLKPGKSETEIVLDMGLFRPRDNFTFEILQEPYVKFSWDKEFGQFTPDMEYTEERARELEKIFRKIRKSGSSRS